jgi:hypothetical protein
VRGAPSCEREGRNPNKNGGEQVSNCVWACACAWLSVRHKKDFGSDEGAIDVSCNHGSYHADTVSFEARICTIASWQ